VRLDLTGQPVSAPVAIGTGAPPLFLNSEFSVLNNAVDCVWNSVTGEFGVVFQDRGTAGRLAIVHVRVRPDGDNRWP
jgi:hypothetical protein